mgnify:CR=1 FL=1
MSDDKQRYKIGDEFKATLVIIGWDDDEPVYNLAIKELEDSGLDDSYSQGELDLAFNPVVIKRKLQDTIDKATKQLEEMDNNDT